MAYENYSAIPGLTAAADLSSDQFKFGKMTASGVIKNVTNGGVVDGVIQDKPDARGRAVTVAVGGVCKVLSGAAVAQGELVMSDAAGKGVVAAPVASSATKAGAVGTYDLVAGTTIVVDVDNAGDATVTWDAAAGTCTDSTTYPVADQAGLTEKVTIDGGAEQTVTFSGVHTAAATIEASMNAQLLGCSVAVLSTHVVITSDTQGTGSTVSIGTGTCGLTWGTPAAGTGDVHNIDAVTPTEVKTRIEADSTANVNLVGSGFEIVSPTTGASSELDFKSGTALTPLGLSVEVKVGQASDSHYRGRAIEAAGGANVLFTMSLAPTGKI